MAFIKPSGYSDFTRRATDAGEVATSVPASALISQSKILDDAGPGAVVLDNACGSGIVTKSLLAHSGADRLEIIDGDLDLTMIGLTQDRIRSQGWTNVRCEKIDAHATPFEDAKFDYVLMNFGPQLMKDPMQMLRESHRILKAGGTIGFTTWTRLGLVPSIKAVFPDWDIGSTPVAGQIWHDAGKIKELLSEAGFGSAEVNTLGFDVETPDLEAFIELVTQYLMAPFFEQGDNRERYGAYMRQEGETKMSWQAFIVTAKK